MFAPKSLTPDATRRWVAYNKGGEFRRWFGNQLHVVDWADGGRQLISSLKAVIRSLSYQGRESLGWSAVSSGRPSFRFFPQGFHFDGAGPSIFPNQGQSPYELLGILNSTVSQRVLAVVAPTLNFVYMHRYTPSTVSTVLNEYLREYRAKLEVALANAELAAAGGGFAKEQKEADRRRGW